MSFEAICKRLPEKEAGILISVRASAERLLNHTPRFRFFTLHGTEHLTSLFDIFEILIEGHLELSRDEIFLLALAICIHDLGMVVTLRDKDLPEILEGEPAFPDPATFENYVRENHHDLVEEYTNQHFGFLTDLGLSPMQVSQIVDISRCHRKIDLDAQFGVTMARIPSFGFFCQNATRLNSSYTYDVTRSACGIPRVEQSVNLGRLALADFPDR